MMRRLCHLLAAALLALPLLAPLSAHAFGQEDLLEPEKAYQPTVQALDAHTVEVRYAIAEGYYLYRSKFRFSAEAPVTLGEMQIPPGDKHHDENFGDVEIYRHSVSIRLPVNAPPGTAQVALTLVSQGCADLGVCYPPLTHHFTVALAPGGSASTTGGAAPFTPRNTDAAISVAKPAAPAFAPAAPALGDSAALAKPAATPPPAASSSRGGDESGAIARLLRHASVWGVIVFFFGAGLLLAFTPCMFPMIPILSGIIVGHGHANTHARAAVLSVAYVLGMAVTYAVAGVAAGLSGTLLSAALQNAWVLGGFALVFVALSLAMFGFYELQLPAALQSRLSDTANRQGGSLAGVVLMGALSAIIVGPCVAAPLAGALLYIAQTGNAALGGVALFVMALGMGAPLVAVGIASRSLLPKSGPWMEAVKKFFGVLLLGVAVWLVSPVLPPVLTMLAWAALLIVPAIYLHALDPLPPHARGWQRFWKGMGVIALLAGASMLLGALAGSRDPLQPLSALRGVMGADAGVAGATAHPPFQRIVGTAELDARLKAANRPVMLDFYADWCVSCKEMERFTFSDPKVAARMRNMLLLQADVTANSDDDKALLQRFGLFGPPGIIFFDAGGSERQGLRVVGFQDADAFGAILDRALKP